MSEVVAESTCRRCEQPIRLIKSHKLDPGQWYHIDGHRAYRECRNVVAEPVQEETAEEKLAAIQEIVDTYRAGDPYHAGRVAHALRVDAALGSMSRIYDVLKKGQEEP